MSKKIEGLIHTMGFNHLIELLYNIEKILLGWKKNGGEIGIRTLGGLPLNGFQDHRFRPLSHLSAKSNRSIKNTLF